MDPMAQMINSLPAGSQQPQGQSSFMTPQQPMFAPPQNPAAQQQAPAAPVMPAAPVVPWQQSAPTPPAPGTPPQQFPAQMPMQPQYQQPGQPAMGGIPGMPMMPMAPQLPSDQNPNQMPAWAQEMVRNIQALGGDQGGQQPGGQASVFDPEQPWSAANRPQTWDDMRRANEAIAAKQAQATISQTLQQQQQQAEQARQAEQQFNQDVDQAFNRLRLTGMLPTVTNTNDPNDPGLQAQAELLGFAVAMGGRTAQDVLVSATQLMQQHSMGRYFDTKTNQMVQRRGQSAAAMAPIAGGMPVMGGMTQAGMTQSQLARGSADLGSLMQMGMEAIQ